MKILTHAAIFFAVIASPCSAAVLNIADFSATPDGASTFFNQMTDVNALNGGQVLPPSGTPTVYVISTFTFGATSDVHPLWQFSTSNTTPNRLGVVVEDTGLVQFVGTSDTNRTNHNIGGDMAGQTVVLLAKLSYDANNSVTYSRTNVSDDTLMNVWVNPTGSSLEGSGLSAGDMSTVWNSSGFSYFWQRIENQNTLGTAGDSFITDTVVLTGADATWANALSYATVPEPSAALLGCLGGLLLLRRRRTT